MPQAHLVRPLESLLLFQSIANHGTGADTFEKAANFLRHCDFFDVSAHDERTDPSHLQDLFLTLLKQRAKRELLNALDKDNNAASKARAAREISPGKRKVTSPRIATLEDARRHEHLVSKMVPELYAQYREQIIQDIKADEERYSTLLRELNDLQQHDDTGSIDELQAPEPHEAHTPQRPPRSSRGITHARGGQDTPFRGSVDSSKGENAAIASRLEVTRGQTNGKYEDFSKGAGKKDLNSDRDAIGKSQTTNVAGGQAALQPQHEKITASLPSSSRKDHSSSRQGNGRPLQPIQTTDLQSSSTKRSGLTSVDQRPRASNNGKSSSAYIDAASIGPADSSTSVDQSGRPRPSSHVGPQSHPAVSKSPSVPLSQAQLRSPLTQSTLSPGGVVLQPFQVVPQAPRDAVSGISSATAQQRQALPPVLEDRRAVSSQVSDSHLHTPVGVTVGAKTGPAVTLPQLQTSLDTIRSDGSSTVWKRKRSGSVPPASVPRSFSPLSDDESGTETATPSRSTRPGRKAKAAHAVTGGRSLAGRAVKNSSSKTPSIAGASMAGRTRSQSVSSYADATSVATPIADSDMGTQEPETPMTATDIGRRIPKRERVDEDSVSNWPPLRNDSVVAWRNFNRMSQPLMDNITSHRHAAIFNQPVKAEGYSDLIKRPQDLKSIRSAISAGARAVTAAIAAAEASHDDALGTISSNGAVITMPFSDDFAPPKAIVNADQLEQELMRMFANALMFNPGTEGVASDTRDMFVDVQRYIDQWRTSDIGDEAPPGSRDGGGSGAADDTAVRIKRRRV